MKKKIVKFFIVVFALLASPFFVLAANDVSFDGTPTFELYTNDATPILTTITGVNGGVVTDLDVELNYIDITLDNGSSATFNTSTSSQYFQVAKQSGSNDYTTSPSCITNQVTLTGTGATVVLRFQVSSTAPGCLGGGGGGGGGYTPRFPADAFVNINAGAEQTGSLDVTLNLRATNATQLMASNYSDFHDGAWESFTSFSKAWTLLNDEPGTKIVYVKYRSSTGAESNVVSDSIEYVTGEEPEETPEGEGECVIDCSKLDYELLIVNPDNSIRTIGNGFVKIEYYENDVRVYKFEDSGSDMDFNDVVIQVDKSQCDQIKVETLSLDAGWHHQIKMKIIYDGEFREEILLWQDSHQSVGNAKYINAYDYGSLCEEIQLDPGDLIKGSNSTVYYYASDGQRYSFPNPNIYFSWYSDYSTVKKISDQRLGTIMLADNVVYRPGMRMIKLQTNSNVYAVDFNGLLHWVDSEELANEIYGTDWNKKIDDLNDAFRPNYDFGDAMTSAAEFDALDKAVKAKNIEVNQNISNLDQFVPVNYNFFNATDRNLPAEPQPAQPSCKADITFTRFLSLESIGTEVRELQEVLKCLGYFASEQSVTGYFGSVTEQAVKDFQIDNEIEAAGYVGPATREALNNL